MSYEALREIGEDPRDHYPEPVRGCDGCGWPVVGETEAGDRLCATCLQDAGLEYCGECDLYQPPFTGEFCRSCEAVLCEGVR